VQKRPTSQGLDLSIYLLLDQLEEARAAGVYAGGSHKSRVRGRASSSWGRESPARLEEARAAGVYARLSRRCTASRTKEVSSKET